MKLIKLSNRNVSVMVDDDQFESLNRFKWHARGKTGYATRTVCMDGRKAAVYLHKLVLGIGQGAMGDHHDGNIYNCQRHNLRICTNRLNQGNSRPKRTSSSPYKGITFDKSRGKWMAQIITDQGHTRHLGRYDNPAAAAKAYDEAATAKYGDFALTNSHLGLI